MIRVVKCRSVEELVDHYTIRKIVFIDEQNVSYEEEFDLVEKERIPFVLYLDKNPIGAARINLFKEYAKIERVCILKEYRNAGYGKFLMGYLIEYIKSLGYKEIQLASQTRAIGFYEKLGFQKYGNEFLDANIPHYKMKKNL